MMFSSTRVVDYKNQEFRYPLIIQYKTVHKANKYYLSYQNKRSMYEK